MPPPLPNKLFCFNCGHEVTLGIDDLPLVGALLRKHQIPITVLEGVHLKFDFCQDCWDNTTQNHIHIFQVRDAGEEVRLN